MWVQFCYEDYDIEKKSNFEMFVWLGNNLLNYKLIKTNNTKQI